EQPHQLILEDDLPGCGGYVLTEAKDLLIGHTDCKLSPTAFEVVQQICQAGEKVLTARPDGALQYLRVGSKKNPRNHGIHELSWIEVPFVRCFRIETIDATDR